MQGETTKTKPSATAETLQRSKELDQERQKPTGHSQAEGPEGGPGQAEEQGQRGRSPCSAIQGGTPQEKGLSQNQALRQPGPTGHSPDVLDHKPVPAPVAMGVVT